MAAVTTVTDDSVNVAASAANCDRVDAALRRRGRSAAFDGSVSVAAAANAATDGGAEASDASAP